MGRPGRPGRWCRARPSQEACHFPATPTSPILAAFLGDPRCQDFAETEGHLGRHPGLGQPGAALPPLNMTQGSGTPAQLWEGSEGQDLMPGPHVPTHWAIPRAELPSSDKPSTAPQVNTQTRSTEAWRDTGCSLGLHLGHSIHWRAVVSPAWGPHPTLTQPHLAAPGWDPVLTCCGTAPADSEAMTTCPVRPVACERVEARGGPPWTQHQNQSHVWAQVLAGASETHTALCT